MPVGQSRKKKINTSKIEAQDIEIIKDDTAETDTGSNFTDEQNFTFQDSPTAEESRLNTKITTNNEHKTKPDEETNTHDHSQDDTNDPFEEDTTGSANDSGGSDTGHFDPGPDIDEIPDDQKKEEKDIFDVEDEPETEEGKLDFRKLQPPSDFPDWSAEKKASWIVDIREILTNYMLGRFSKVSIYYVKSQGRKYIVPKDILDKVLKDYEQYNQHIDNAIALPPFYKKILKHLWTQVLKESPGLAKKNTPLVALITTEITFLAMQIDEMQRAKKFGEDMMMFHKNLFEEFYEHSKKTVS